MQHFVNHNGEFIERTIPLFTADNRAFQYGDALFETIRFVNGVPLFFEDHFHRLLSGMMFLQMQFEEKLDMNFFMDQIVLLCSKNNHSASARVRLELYRKQGGYYTPEESAVGFLIQTEALATPGFEIAQKGLKIDIYKDLQRPLDKLSNLKTSNSLPFVLAGLYKKQKGLDDCLLLNSTGRIAESISSNIFIVRQGILYTPSLSEGCVAGVMRLQVFKIAKQFGKKIIEKALTTEELLLADEVFLTNAISGIRWVVAFQNKRYFNTTSKWFLEQLNLLF